ncbi:MAG TPA: cytochrome-c oxidase, cbb3-type subunit III, partial [Steroidobacteraceae bacterium]|nr:cytochrome-c oxidase, cbb3-type subunit III [Steroidobacteraceae bacterium]
MSSATSLFIAVFTIVNIIGCLWLIWWTAKRRPGEQKTTGHVWDGDLEEYNNPLPRWWLWLFILTIVWGLAYLVFYPGLGKFEGTSNWSSVSQYQGEVERIESRVEEIFAPFAAMDLRELARNETAMGAAKNLYGNNCAACHGSDGRGARGFPNLTDDDWLWGSDPDQIYQSIAQGRMGVMPALGTALGNQGVEHVIAYVLSLSGRDAPQDWVAAGKTQFDVLCASCHGVDGKGNNLLGAPNLTDDTWLYGSSPEAIRETIVQGRNNQMPAHLDLLGETRVRLLAAYVLKLSGEAGAET